MSDLVIRSAIPEDAAALATLVEGFAAGHPASSHARSTDRFKEAYFGPDALGRIVIAEHEGSPIGFGIWRKAYDPFWSMYGGDGLGLYVTPSHRGRGVALAIVAALCEEIRQAGGEFLQTSYDPELAELYERIAIGRAERACHVSATAFQTLASLAGRSPREIVRGLPDKTLNFAPKT